MTLPSTPVILKEKAHLQPWLSKKTKLIEQETFQVTWVDGHKTPSIGTRKPDILHYVKGCSQSVYLLAYLGDLKSQTAHTSGDPSDEAIACLIDFFCALAAIQVWRREFIGYLLDGKHISFFVVRFDFSPNRGDIRAIVGVAAQPPFPPCLLFFIFTCECPLTSCRIASCSPFLCYVLARVGVFFAACSKRLSRQLAHRYQSLRCGQ